jgi:hypothetical protein
MITQLMVAVATASALAAQPNSPLPAPVVKAAIESLATTVNVQLFRTRSKPSVRL